METEYTAATVEQARERALADLAPGMVLGSETVVHDGRPAKETAQAPDEDEALKRALSAVPEGATVVRQELILRAATRVVEVEASDVDCAARAARDRASSHETTAEVTLLAQGARGFLGIGRTPNRYAVVLRSEAMAEVVYQWPAKIRITAVSHDEQVLAAFWREDTRSARDVYAFIRDHTEDEIETVCRLVPFSLDKLERFERLLTFATILTGYPEALRTYPSFGLPAGLAHRRLAELFMPRLMDFIATLPDWMAAHGIIERRVIAERMYDFAMKLLVNDYPREALACLRVHALQPVKADGRFWIFGALCNIVADYQDPAARAEAIATGKALLAEAIPADQKTAVEQRLAYLQ